MAPFFEKSSFTFQPFQRHPEVPEVLTEDFFMFARLVLFFFRTNSSVILGSCHWDSPPTKSLTAKAPEKSWLEDDPASLLGFGNFSGARC